MTMSASSDIGKGDLVEYIGGMGVNCSCRCGAQWCFAVGSRFIVTEIISKSSGQIGFKFEGIRVGPHTIFFAKYFRKVRDLDKWLSQPVTFEEPTKQPQKILN